MWNTGALSGKKRNRLDALVAGGRAACGSGLGWAATQSWASELLCHHGQVTSLLWLQFSSL